MSALWTAAETVAATGGQPLGGLAADGWTAGGVSIDTRSLRPGDLFVALRGESRDGHAFVADALARGAAGALVAERPVGLAAEAPLLLVADPLKGLEALGRAGRARSRARIAGVTGSVGKTGTKEALRHVLSRQAPTHASAASYNNHWGVPLSLARLPADAAYGVFELGMNHAGEIAPLTRMVRPHMALITTIEPAHLEFFGRVEAIADAKAEIFLGLEPDGVAVLNRDNPYFERLRDHAVAAGAGRLISFGSHAEADFRLRDAALDADGSEVVVERRGRTLRYRLGLPGRHWVLNSLAVLAAVEVLGADVERAAEALASLEPPPGRGARLAIRAGSGTGLLLDESYNANPASVRAALDVLGRLPGRRIAVLGDMLELGESAPALHAGLVDAVAAAGVERLFTCGPLMRHLHAAVEPWRRAVHAAGSSELVAPLRDALRAGDVVLVKGSLGSRMGRIVEALRAEAPPLANTVQSRRAG
jgi:UDP-N-acetylmuramoyl-tripeptide--D-alanyl-D-alanine ligase